MPIGHDRERDRAGVPGHLLGWLAITERRGSPRRSRVLSRAATAPVDGAVVRARRGLVVGCILNGRGPRRGSRAAPPLRRPRFTHHHDVAAEQGAATGPGPSPTTDQSAQGGPVHRRPARLVPCTGRGSVTDGPDLRAHLGGPFCRGGGQCGSAAHAARGERLGSTTRRRISAGRVAGYRDGCASASCVGSSGCGWRGDPW